MGVGRLSLQLGETTGEKFCVCVFGDTEAVFAMYGC